MSELSWIEKDRREYERGLLRVSAAWGEWDECTQVRRPSPSRYEFRRSTPACMLAALALVAAALDTWLFGMLVPIGHDLLGWALVAAAPVVFVVGRGVTIDGHARRVTTWWGFVPRPLVARHHVFDDVASVRMTRTHGFARSSTGGRTVRRPVHIVMRSGRRHLLKPCRWVDAARALGGELAAILGVPFHDEHPEDLDSVG